MYGGPENFRMAQQEIDALGEGDMDATERLICAVRAVAHATQAQTAAILETSFDLDERLAKAWRDVGAIS